MDFPFTLDLKNYSNISNKDEYYQYDLKGIVIH